MGDFFSFRRMISAPVVKVLYVLGIIPITLLGGVKIFASFGVPAPQRWDVFLGTFPLGVALLAIGNLVWRIVCEAVILLFNTHERLLSIERKVSKQ